MSMTLLLQLAGPMQAWGVQSRFEIRDTMTEPSKSGVIGLICAALGRDRSEDISDLAALKMGVRIDQEGQMRRDYHTAKRSKKDRRTKIYGPPQGVATLSTRYYLADAMFLVGLEGENPNLLEQIHHAVAFPFWPIWLGRKAFPPSRSVQTTHGILNLPLLEALESVPLLAHKESHASMADQPDNEEKQIRLVIEASAYQDEGLAKLRRPDQPVSFEPRKYALRDIIVAYCSPPIAKEEKNVSEQT